MENNAIEQGRGYIIRLCRVGAGRACSIVQEASGRGKIIAGEEAQRFLAERDELRFDHNHVPTSRAARIPWPELLNTMRGAYFM